MQITVSVVMVPQHNQATLPFYDEIAAASGGQARLIRQDDPVRKYWSLVTALRDICDDSIGSVTVASDIHTISDHQSRSSGDFLVDSSLGRDTIFGIIVEDEEDHLIDNVVFENENGEVFGPYSHIATTFDTINMKTISFGLTRNQPFGDRGHVGQRWRYTVSWHRTEARREAVVMVTSRPRARDTRVGRDLTEVSEEVEVKMWTSDAAFLPLTMYVSVHKGGRPVIGALVEVSVEVTSPGLGDTIHLGPLHVHDKGDGDPDLMSADGVYTRRLTEYPVPGRYVFSAHVSSVANVTRVLSPANDSDHVSWLVRCCGSTALSPLSLLTPCAPFSRVTGPGPVVSLSPDLVSDPDLALESPSRVTDLRTSLVTQSSDSLTVTWSSEPGPLVTSSTLLISDNISLLLGPVSEMVTSDQVTQVRLERGRDSHQSHELCLKPDYGNNFYIGLISESSANITGRISNLVSVMLPERSVSPGDQDRGLEMMHQDDGSQSMIILGVCVSLLLLALSLGIAVLYFVKFRRNKGRPVVSRHPGLAANSGGVHRDDLTDNTSCSSDARNNSGNNLMPDLGAHIHTISAMSRPSPGPYLFTAPPPALPDSTPTYWSATKLLTEHEQRALAMSYAPLNGGHLTAVKEEYIGYPEEYPPSYLDDDSLTYSINNMAREAEAERGIANPNFRHSLGAGLAIYDPECSDSGSQAAGEAGDPETPVRFSTAVQTIAPSTIARLRQNNTYLASLQKTRNVSLV